MTIHRFFISPDNINEGVVKFPPDISLQISKVLRLKIGDKVTVLDNSLYEYDVELGELSPKFVAGKILLKRTNHKELPVKIHLYQSLISKDKFELVLQKATELGVYSIIPIETERTQFKSSFVTDEKIERWKRIVKEAAEQSAL